MKKKHWFKKKFLEKSFKRGADMKFGDVPNTGAPYTRIISGIRPSFSRNRDTVIVTIYRALQKDPKQDLYYVIAIDRRRCTYVEEVEFSADHIQRMHSDEISMDLESEYNGFSRLLSDAIPTEFSRPSFTFHRKDGNRFLTPLGVRRVSGLFTKGLIVLPSDFNDSHTREEINLLRQEMDAYPKDPIGSTLFALTLALVAEVGLTRQKILIPEKSKPTPTPGTHPVLTGGRNFEESPEGQEMRKLLAQSMAYYKKH
ncbi:MAG: hypothetical protein ABSB00_01160 [Minisyncoccia bacterium]|jgi:hypothetical protein